MKRSELVVGAELYHARRTTWEYNNPGEKVTVIAVEPYKWDRIYQRNRLDANRGAAGVLVSYGDDSERQVVVRLADLRGPWEEVSAAVEARREAQRQRYAEEERRRAEREAAFRRAASTRSDVIQRAADMGFKATASTSLSDMGRGIVVDVEVLAEMLDRIQQLNTERNTLIDQVNGTTEGVDIDAD